MNPFASLVILSYNRKEYLERSLESLWKNTEYPYELIICDDASDTHTQAYLYGLVAGQKISTLLINSHHNMGIGVAVNRGFQIARGDYLFKLDADLEYKRGWLSTAVDLLSNNQIIGCLGLFKYWHQPCNFPDEVIKDCPEKGYTIVKDFVGSAVCMRRGVYDLVGKWVEPDTSNGAFSEDINFKRRVQAQGMCMALPTDELAVNFGFGEQHSSLIKKIDWEGGKHAYNIPDSRPLVFAATK